MVHFPLSNIYYYEMNTMRNLKKDAQNDGSILNQFYLAYISIINCGHNSHTAHRIFVEKIIILQNVVTTPNNQQIKVLTHYKEMSKASVIFQINVTKYVTETFKIGNRDLSIILQLAITKVKNNDKRLYINVS